MSDFTHDPHSDDELTPRKPGELVPRATTNITPQNAWQPPAPIWLDGGSANEGMDVFGFMHALRRRWLPGFLIGSVLATIIAALMWFLIPTSYEAEGYIKVKRNVQRMLESTLHGESPDEYAVFKQTQPAMIKSPYVLSEALRDEKNITPLPMIQAEERPLAWLQKELQVSYVTNSELLRIAIRGDDTNQPIKIVDAVMNAYIKRIEEEEKISDSTRLQRLKAERTKNIGDIRKALVDIIKLGEASGANDNIQAGINRQLELGKLDRMEGMLDELEQDIRNIGTQMVMLQTLRRARGNSVNPLDIQDLLESDPKYFQISQMLELYVEQQQMTAQGGQAGASNDALTMQIGRLRKQLKDRAKVLEPRLANRVRKMEGMNENMEQNNMILFQTEMQTKVQLLEEAKQKYQDQLEVVKTLASADSNLELKKDELESLRRANKVIEEEMERVQLNMDSEKRISILQPAVIPDMSNVRVKLIGVAAAWLTVLCATIFGIAMWDYVEKHLNSPAEVEKDLKLPMLGMLPALRGGGLMRMFSGPMGESVVADAIDSIRTGISFGDKGRKLKSILITSASEKEGKTTVASQLAVSMARAGKRTLLIDGDLRNPRQHAVFGLPPERGLAEVLRGDAQLEEVIQSTPAESLWILPAGQCNMQSLQALAGPGIGSIMNWCNGQFDQVVIDCSPVLVGAEAMMIGQHVDGAILASRRDVSRLAKIEEAARKLASVGVRVVGVVVNGGTTETRRTQMAIVAK